MYGIGAGNREEPERKSGVARVEPRRERRIIRGRLAANGACRKARFLQGRHIAAVVHVSLVYPVKGGLGKGGNGNGEYST